MEYLLLWLLLGNISYTLALTLKTYELGYKAKVYKSKIKKTYFLLGLSGILLGPIALVLISWNRDNIKNE